MAARLGKYLRDLRKEQGLTTAQVGEIAECDRSFISHIERGSKFPSLLRLWKITEGVEGDFAKALFFLCLDSGVPEDVARQATGQ